MIDVLLVVLVLIGIALIVWGRSDGDNAAGPVPPTTDPAATSVRFPDDQIVWQVDQTGGPTSEVAHAAHRPSITVYGDGRILLVRPAHDPRYDEPIPLLEGRADRAAVATFLARVEKSGLLEPDGGSAEFFGRPESDGLFTTTITVHGRSGRHTVDIYGLGGRFDTEVAPEYAERREELRQLLHDAELLAGTPEAVDPDRIRVLLLDRGATFEEKPEVEQIEEIPTWPGPAIDRFAASAPSGTDEKIVIGCTELDGTAAADVFTSALENTTPHWLVDGQRQTIIAVELLPGEAACG